MKKLIAITFLVMTTIQVAYAYVPQCQQKYVCGPAGCRWITVCW